MISHETVELLRKEKYWDKVTEDTTIEWLARRMLLSLRASNILVRGAIYAHGKMEYKPIKTVKELLEVDDIDLMRYRNMGKKSIEEIQNFKAEYLSRIELCQKIRNAPIITEQGQADWLDGYKVGFRDGVIAVQTRLNDICKELTEGKNEQSNE